MQVKVKKFTNGSISYRLPNIVESMRLLGAIGIKSDGSLPSSEMTLMADLIEQLEPYVQEIKVSNKEVSWEDALQDLKMLTPLSEIGTEVLASLNQSSEGRKQRKKS